MSGQAVIEDIAGYLKPRSKGKLRVAVLVSGNGSNLQALIDFSKTDESFFSITSVITNNPKSWALERAAKASINHHLIDHRTFKHREQFEAKLAVCLRQDASELVVLAGFMRVLGGSFLGQFEHRVINLHPSLLPKHRGLNAIEKALVAHDKEAGCTVHLVDAGLDTGPIIAQSSCPINKNDDLETLTKRIQALEHALLPDVVNRIATAAMTKEFA